MKANQDILNSLIAQAKGKFFSIEFIKNDGTVRVANAKDKYQRLLSGGESTVREAGYTSMVDRNKESWIAAKGERVKRFKCGKIERIFAV